MRCPFNVKGKELELKETNKSYKKLVNFQKSSSTSIISSPGHPKIQKKKQELC